MEPSRLSERKVRSLYERHAGALALYARSFGLDVASAQDVVQQIFLKLLSGATGVPQLTPGYLFRAVRNACLNVRRDAAKTAPLDAGVSWLVHREGNRELELTLQSALAGLPEDQREVVILHVWGGLTLQEIADVATTSLNTAASRYRYALDKLRKAFDNEDSEGGKPRP